MWQANWLFSGIKGDGMKKTVKTVKKGYAIWIFVLLVFVFYLSWALAAPFDASPDESMRYQIVEFIVKHGTLPDGRDPEIRNANWGISYAFNPILPYMAGAVFAKVVQVFTDSFRATVIAARMVNVLLGCGMAWFTWKIGELLFRKKETGRLFAVLVCFLPGTCFLFSYINTDGLALFTTAWILYCWCRACKEGWTLKVCVQMGIAMGLCMLSYYNAYGYLLMSAVFFAGCMMKCGEQQWDWQQLLKKGCLMLGIVFLVAGWWFIRSGILYDGDFLGMKTSSIYAEKYAIDELKPSNRVLPVNMGMSVLDMIWWVPGEWQHNWLVTVLVSFVGTFGHLDIFMPYLWSKVYLIVFAVGILGNSWRLRREFCLTTEFVKKEKKADADGILITEIWRKNRWWNMRNWMHICMVGAMVIPVGLLVYYAYASDFQAQGRYIMPMALPFFYFVTLGYENWSEKLIRNEKISIWICRIGQGTAAISVLLTYVLVYRAAY
ncbi:DUF2142 domain-containing protein [Blautia sp. AM16-16B]|nr:DUF2142 domain-containing protein [Blautia sp. AM16-16B]RHS51908.1 DUF2142 domain-containing protein [Blautia sp. AM46-5]RHS57240.1 DUF2142 domain-containing protein [Blautia sp. AM46-3MH]